MVCFFLLYKLMICKNSENTVFYFLIFAKNENLVDLVFHFPGK